MANNGQVSVQETLTIYGVPIDALLKDERFRELIRVIMRERGDDPDEWTALRGNKDLL